MSSKSSEILLCLTEQVFQCVCPIFVVLYAIVYPVHISLAFDGMEQFDDISETLLYIIGYEYVRTLVPGVEGGEGERLQHHLSIGKRGNMDRVKT